MACMSSVGEWVESGLPLAVSQPSNSRNWVVSICKVRREPSLHVTRTTAHTYPGELSAAQKQGAKDTATSDSTRLD